jgi:hypothetical protein
LIFIDESAINNKVGERHYGRGYKGQRIHSKVTGARSKNISLLPALTIDGYITCTVFEGAVNGPTFRSWIKNRLLPHCTPFPGPRSVIVMDNTKIHKGDVLLY